MSQIKNVSDIRAEAHRNEEDRNAIRRSIVMALIGVAAVSVAALLASIEKDSRSLAREPVTQTRFTSSTVSAPAEPVEGAVSRQYVTPPGEMIEAPSY